MQIKDKRKAIAKLQATCNSHAERNSSICFCKLLGQCPSMELLYRGVWERGMAWTAFIPACFHVLNSLKFRLLPKNCPREWRLGWRLLHGYAGLLVDATMIALFACWWLEQNGNGRANADNNKSWLKSLIVSDYNRIQYNELDSPKNWAQSNH